MCRGVRLLHAFLPCADGPSAFFERLLFTQTVLRQERSAVLSTLLLWIFLPCIVGSHKKISPPYPRERGRERDWQRHCRTGCGRFAGARSSAYSCFRSIRYLSFPVRPLHKRVRCGNLGGRAGPRSRSRRKRTRASARSGGSPSRVGTSAS